MHASCASTVLVVVVTATVQYYSLYISLFILSEFVHAKAYESHTHNQTYLYILVLITGNKMPSMDHGRSCHGSLLARPIAITTSVE